MALSFHRVREAIAAKIIGFYHVDRVQKNPMIFLASIGVTSKFGNCFALRYSGQKIRLIFLTLRTSRCQTSQDPGDWYLMAASARQHLLPFGNYSHVTFILADPSLKRTGIDKKHKRIGSRETTRDCDFGFSLRVSLAIYI
jgi:hypothetical protein